MRLTKSARKDHGQCFYCPEPILQGQSFYTTMRPATRRNVQLFPGAKEYRGQIPVKIHKDCVDNLRNVKQFLRGFMRLWWGRTSGAVAARAAYLENP